MEVEVRPYRGAEDFAAMQAGEANLALQALYASLGCVVAETSRRYARPVDTIQP